MSSGLAHQLVNPVSTAGVDLAPLVEGGRELLLVAYCTTYIRDPI